MSETVSTQPRCLPISLPKRLSLAPLRNAGITNIVLSPVDVLVGSGGHSPRGIENRGQALLRNGLLGYLADGLTVGGAAIGTGLVMGAYAVTEPDTMLSPEGRGAAAAAGAMSLGGLLAGTAYVVSHTALGLLRTPTRLVRLGVGAFNERFGSSKTPSCQPPELPETPHAPESAPPDP